jgi:hypothetical protein
MLIFPLKFLEFMLHYTELLLEFGKLWVLKPLNLRRLHAFAEHPINQLTGISYYDCSSLAERFSTTTLFATG